MTSSNQTIVDSLNYQRRNADILIPFEVVVVLSNRPKLLGFYVDLVLLHQLECVTYLTYTQIAKLLGMSKGTFLKYKNELKSKHLIEERVTGTNKRISWWVKIYTRVQNLNREKGFSKVCKWLDATRKSISKQAQKDNKKILTNTIYNIYNTNNNNINTNNNTKVLSNSIIAKVSKNKEKKKQGKRFKKEWYEKVLEAYQAYKGIGLRGSERLIPMKTIKDMFRAGNTPDDICAFMKWIKDNKDDKRFPWFRVWTINTIKKKMPEWRAGKLQELTNSWEDDIKQI